MYYTIQYNTNYNTIYYVGQEYTIIVKDPFSFEINADTTKLCKGIYQRGGHVNQVKQPITMSFLPWTTSLIQPGEFVCDFNKMGSVGVLHLAFRSVLD